MQRIIQSQTHSKTQDMQRDYYLNQKKTLEVSFTSRCRVVCPVGTGNPKLFGLVMSVVDP
jgi:hypothetical protein